jgi:hypothetical protein
MRKLLIACLGMSAFACRPRLKTSDVEALPQNRRILGQPTPWTPLTLEPQGLKTSMAARRAAGWETLARAVAPVGVKDPATGEPLREPESGAPLTVPTWQTWYDIDEFKEMFLDLYWGHMSDAQRASHRVDDAMLDQVIADHPSKPLGQRWMAPSSQPGMTRFDRLLSQLKGNAHTSGLNGVSGRGFTGYSPELVRHYLKHYWEVYNCRRPIPPEFTTGNPDKDLASCFSEPFPKGSVTIKATWNKVGDGVGAFDTTARGVAKTMGPAGETWRPMNANNLSFPSSDKIHTSYTFNDEELTESYQLTGLHIVTKDVPEWIWMTAWWSRTPSTDYGEDRPKRAPFVDASNRGTVWSNYKMCVASSFEEEDDGVKAMADGLTPAGLLESTDTSLKAVLAASYVFAKPEQWCSNPYIETTSGFANSNCIGCHQHAGPEGEQDNPDRARARKNFMTDFMWSFDSFNESFFYAVAGVVELTQ